MTLMQNYKIFSYVDDIIEKYKEPIEVVEGLFINQEDILKQIEYYSESRYMSGSLDELGREKPFYNVVNYRVTTAKVATDLDVKDIKFEADSLKYSVQNMIINKEVYKFLKESNFSKFLNDAGYTRPKYGGVLAKKCVEYEENGEETVEIDVVAWKNVSVDPNNIEDGIIVETHYMNPSEVSEMDGKWENVDKLLKAHAKANKNEPCDIEIQEAHGYFPLDFYPDNEDGIDYKYERMMFILGVVNKKKFMLYYEKEKENPYKYLAWEARGDGLGRGVVEDGFESQWSINDSIISMKNAMELSGKVVLATTSKKVSGNAITGIDNGHIFQMGAGETITSLNLSASSLPQFQNIIELWNQQYDRTASTFNANIGEAPTAGTPYSQTALLNQVANSPFEFRREEYGIWLNGILNDWILPYVKKRISKKHYLLAEFDDAELAIIDDSIAEFEAKKAIKEKLLAGEVMTAQEYVETKDAIKRAFSTLGKKRELKIPKGFLDVEGNLTANITGELKNKQAILASLDNILKTIISTFNPNTGQYSALEDPQLSKLFGTIVEMAGIPISFSQIKPANVQTPKALDLSAITPVTPQDGAPAIA
jgi:hypothetical protein